ncbi:hypothetical protein FOA52_009392 [Chlamydomonas sp. UWO 241]|nr:hypothetical protein FOA52_009392 [Chlamydomonas sp. UWO 241]
MAPANGTSRTKGASVRVVVRVRPITSTDTTDSCEALKLHDDGEHVILTPPEGPADARKGHQYAFDACLGQNVSQEDVYATARVQELVDAAASGYHATVFAYGQTGSGKTFTMEGFRYSGGAPPEKQGQGANRKGGAAAPAADFEGTPPEQLGVTPRAVHELFEALAKDPERRASVRCSYVQIYKEQAYDLLNPTSSMMGPDGHQITVPANKKQPGWHTGAASTQALLGMPGALRMRWTKNADFYLENLFKVECNSADEALDLFRSGCANKIMASHRLNHSSSRSHCLFTLYIDSNPLASPTEAANGDEQTPAARVLPPYRDSKLTSLLKNSLGGNAVTLMIACLAPVDTFYEENLSTLEYARQAGRITNQITMNEDPRTRLIRELRAEVAFLREQLAAVQGPGAAAALSAVPPTGAAPLPGGGTSPDGLGGGKGGKNGGKAAAAATIKAGTGGAAAELLAGAGSAGTAAVAAGNVEDMRAALLKSTQHDIGMMVSKLVDAVTLVSSLSNINGQLRRHAPAPHTHTPRAYDNVSKHSEELRIDNDTLMMENAQAPTTYRDWLSFIKGMAGIEGHP